LIGSLETDREFFLKISWHTLEEEIFKEQIYLWVGGPWIGTIPFGGRG